MRAGTTPKPSVGSVFEALKTALKRTGENPRESVGTRMMILEVDDASSIASMCGSHRIQRIPPGSKHRHTSTATITIVEDNHQRFILDEADLSEKFQRGSGPGGQHRNKTESCVTLTHIPTGETVRIDMRSQYQSRQTARRELTKRLESRYDDEANAERNDRRTASSERSAKTFTHNEQRDEVVDHQTGRKWRMSDWTKGKF